MHRIAKVLIQPIYHDTIQSPIVFHEYIFIVGLIYSETSDLRSGLVSSVRRALASKLRGPGFKSQPGTVGSPVTIIMWGARPGWKLALS